MKAINVDTLEWFQVIFGADKQKAILILKPHINDLDIIDAEPVRHGRWIFDGAIYYDEGEKCYDYQCSECGRFVSVRGGSNLGKEELKEEYPYCHCGAKMDLKEYD